MSLDQLTALTGSSPAAPSPSTRMTTWLLPIGLGAGFLAIFALLFGPRIIPALKVQTAPVITLRTGNSTVRNSPVPNPQPPESAPSASKPVPSAPDLAPSGPLLFQASGWVEPDPYTTYVPTLIDGVVAKVLVLEGEAVQKDQLLATLVDDDALLNVQEAEQRIASIKTKRTAHYALIPVLEAEQDAARKKISAENSFLAELRDTADRLIAVNKGAISELEVTKAKLKVEQQVAAVAAAQAEIPRFAAKINQVKEERKAFDSTLLEARTDLARHQLALDRCRILAPMDGIVLRLHAVPGKKRMLRMDDPKSAVIVELFDPEHLQVRIDVPLNEAAGLAIGQPVQISTDLLPDVKLPGTVTRLAGEADIQRNTLQAKVRIHHPPHQLRPEMLVRAEFYPATASAPTTADPSRRERRSGSNRLSLYAPTPALFERSGQSAKAWVLIDGRAEPRTLTTGTEKRDDHLLILEGLRSGDRLILPPHHKLKPGTRVQTKN